MLERQEEETEMNKGKAAEMEEEGEGMVQTKWKGGSERRWRRQLGGIYFILFILLTYPPCN